MSAVLDLLHSQLGPQNIEAISHQLGLEPKSARKAVGAAIPFLTGELARKAGSPQGAAALQRALAQHDGGLLEQSRDDFFEGDARLGAKLLDHILPGVLSIAAAGVARSADIDTTSAGHLLSLLAPLVLGALGRLHHVEVLEPGDVAGLVLAEHDEAREEAPPEVRNALPGMLGPL